MATCPLAPALHLPQQTTPLLCRASSRPRRDLPRRYCTNQGRVFSRSSATVLSSYQPVQSGLLLESWSTVHPPVVCALPAPTAPTAFSSLAVVSSVTHGSLARRRSPGPEHRVVRVSLGGDSAAVPENGVAAGGGVRSTHAHTWMEVTGWGPTGSSCWVMGRNSSW